MNTFLTNPNVQNKKKEKKLNSINNVNDDSYDRDARKQVLWNNILDKISFENRNEQYTNNYPIKPGFEFWKALCTIPNSLDKLKVNLPETFIVLGSNSYTWIRMSILN